MVLPAWAASTIEAALAFADRGHHDRIMRAVRSSVVPLPISSCSRDLGNSGVRFENRILCLAFSGGS
jgi:NRPS condensation-like uncharacterized protein